MPTVYHVIGAENSPYSVKVRSYFRYKQIPHEWLSRGQAQEEYQRHAKLPLVPLVVTSEDEGIQDSTPIIERMEQRFPEPSIHPADPVASFCSVLVEEWGDEWGNKWMFHYRWAREVDQIAASRRLVGEGMPDAADDEIEQRAATVRERMVDRVWFVGSNEITGPQIEKSFTDTLSLLEAHLANRSYLFGARPAFADFALWGQIYNARKDPTPQSILADFPSVNAWLDRMVEPANEGEHETWKSLGATLTPVLEEQIGRLFLPWDQANAEAVADGKEEFSVELAGEIWTQKPQRYHAKSFGELRRKYAEVRDDAELNAVLEQTHCLRWLEP
jgi:glutathione S-transferase